MKPKSWRKGNKHFRFIQLKLKYITTTLSSIMIIIIIIFVVYEQFTHH